MPVFVHLAPERALRSIRRGGIVPPRVRIGARGVYALPVTHKFYARVERSGPRLKLRAPGAVQASGALWCAAGPIHCSTALRNSEG